MMMSGVPNMAWSMGYTNARTLKRDLTCAYVCRLLDHMEKTGKPIATPQTGSEDPGDEPMIDLTSGYVRRAMALFPKQGTHAPWKLYQNYTRDLLMLRFGAVEDGVMNFTQASAVVGEVAEPSASGAAMDRAA